MPAFLNQKILHKRSLEEMGKLIIIDGVDGSGKSTQIKLLSQSLVHIGKKVMQIKFPCYDSQSSALVKMYLAGDFGSDANDVNAYAASSFYAVDRYASYKKDWQQPYEDGAIIISDRYVSSNIIHQGSKFPQSEALCYFDWLYDFEYEKMCLPRPDMVFFLDVDPMVSKAQVEKRYEGDESKKDIHEKDEEYLVKCYKTALFACEHGYMTRIECMNGCKIKTQEEISEILFSKINI